MAQIRARIVNSLGTFDGFMELNGDATLAEATEAVDGLIENVDSINRLAIILDNGGKTVFNQAILKQSVLTLWALE